MTSQEIDKLINDRKKYTVRTFDQKSYRIGVNSAIYRNTDRPEPDNRIPVPFIRRAMKLIKGYFAKVGNITYSSADQWFTDNMKNIYEQNYEGIVTAEVFEDAGTYGSGFEYHWYGKDKKFHFGALPIDQCVPVYSDDLRPELIGFLWHRTLSDGTDCATYYDDKTYTEYLKTKRDSKNVWVENPEMSGTHLYGRVPILEANVDRDKKNLFDHCLPMSDFYDRLTSEVANEHEKFAESILLLRDYIDSTTTDSDGRSEVDKLQEYRILDRLGDHVKDAAAYLERNVNDTFISNTLDRFERLIYEMLCIVNYSADNFAEASGVAQAYKLLGQELMIADIEGYFVKFLRARLNLIANHKTSGIKDKTKAAEVSISFKRNLPFDVQSIISVASVALGGKQVLSHKTLLKLFPSTLVSDAEEELARIALESDTVSDPLKTEEPMSDDNEPDDTQNIDNEEM